MAGLTWIHLSDWHQKGPDFDRQVVRDALLADLKRRAALDPRLASVDLLFFSGDVAWSGAQSEFAAARRELFDPLLALLKEGGLSGNRILFVPGNHDLSLDHVREMLPAALTRPLKEEAEVQHWLTDEKRRGRALEPFEHYEAFVSGLNGQSSPAYASSVTLSVGPMRVGVACLNSAWMCGRHRNSEGRIEDRGYLTVGEPQLLHALREIEPMDLRIALVHHPLDWLAEFDRNRIRKRLKQVCHFVLHGHEHQPDFELVAGASGHCGFVPAGAAFDKRTPGDPHYANAYNLVHLDFAAGEGVIFLRRWDDVNSRWREDIETHANGRMTFALPKQLARTVPVPSMPVSPEPDGDSAGIRAYRERLLAQTADLHLIGLGHGLEIKLPIEQAYVPLNVAVTRDLERREDVRFKPEEAGRRGYFDANVHLDDVFRTAGKFGLRGVLLLGDPGAGKTTGARKICWQALTTDDLPKTLDLAKGTLPVLLRLRNLTPSHLDSGLKSFIRDSVAGALTADGDAALGDELLKRREILWVFDGLDEVVSEEARIQVCGWIRSALTDRPGDHFIVTSRYQGYHGDVHLGSDFCVFHVRPLEREQSALFVKSWYRAVYFRLFGKEPEITDRADQEASALLELLAQPDYRIGRLRELPANPLLLTILCLVHHQDHNLPRRRADLYARCVRVLVEHWRQDVRKAQGLGGFDPEAAEGVLSELAWWLHEEEGRVTQEVSQWAEVAGKALAGLGEGAGLGRDGRSFIVRMRDDSGILATWSPGQCQFLHLTFQEHLAGQHGAREGRAEELASRLGRSWWREVILLAVASGSRDFSQRFFGEVVRCGAVDREPTLVDQCLEEARYPVLEPFMAAIREAAGDEGRQLRLLHRLAPFARAGAQELIRLLRGLVDAREEQELAFLAAELLQRCGETAKLGPTNVIGEAVEQHLNSRTGMVFVRIPAGEFLMGSETGSEVERPVRKVRITRSFLLGKYPVTNEEYERFLRANPGVEPPKFWSNSQWNGPRQPVVGVSWEDAMAYCRWVSCRLPTEAEWEYACRAGTSGEYCFGDDPELLDEYAWFGGNSEGRTREVGQKKSNTWGLHDMHGNVWEWCQDWYAKYPPAREAVEDPQGPKMGTSRVVRGGSWFNYTPQVLRSAYRDDGAPEGRGNVIGFRCVWVESSSP